MLLARDDEGMARAFLNVCRHRGAKLERAASGCKRVFTCPYHAWNWTNTGELRSVLHEAQVFPDLPRAERGLRRLPVAEAHGFIWIVANADAGGKPDIDDWLSGLQVAGPCRPPDRRRGDHRDWRELEDPDGRRPRVLPLPCRTP